MSTLCSRAGPPLQVSYFHDPLMETDDFNPLKWGQAGRTEREREKGGEMERERFQSFLADCLILSLTPFPLKGNGDTVPHFVTLKINLIGCKLMLCRVWRLWSGELRDDLEHTERKGERLGGEVHQIQNIWSKAALYNPPTISLL